MNIALSSRHSVHARRLSTSGTPLCRELGTVEEGTFQQTADPVTCKRCVKILADTQEARDRIAYNARLADAQDMDLSQTAPSAEVTKPVDEEKALWNYRAHVQTRHGAFVKVTTGQVLATDAADVERMVRAGYPPLVNGRKLGNFHITRA